MLRFFCCDWTTLSLKVVGRAWQDAFWFHKWVYQECRCTFVDLSDFTLHRRRMSHDFETEFRERLCGFEETDNAPVTVPIWASLAVQRWRMCGGTHYSSRDSMWGELHCTPVTMHDLVCTGRILLWYEHTVMRLYLECIHCHSDVIRTCGGWLICVCCSSHARHDTTVINFQLPWPGFWKSVLQMHRQLSWRSCTLCRNPQDKSHSACGHMLCCICFVKLWRCSFFKRTKQPSLDDSALEGRALNASGFPYCDSESQRKPWKWVFNTVIETERERLKCCKHLLVCPRDSPVVISSWSPVETIAWSHISVAMGHFFLDGTGVDPKTQVCAVYSFTYQWPWQHQRLHKPSSATVSCTI